MAMVGIFSRSSTHNYRWLLQFLYSFLPEDNVRSVLITNNSPLFISGISFAILYHSKTRGRINVTDVTDALYDSELKELSRALGAENVIVVIDDLDDNSEQQKNQILDNQPSIRILARDLFLFNAQNKEDLEINPTNASNKSQIQELITERSSVSFISLFYLCFFCSGLNSRTNEMRSRRRWMVGITAVVLLFVYMFSVFWYNRRVLLW
ncbi:uncharacterized protein LOC121008950 [Bufo bufo]|uniref:uncharacterized protein LOC121008950 n=1 Tax=Bufo bufo TaxID=8384 RepID=UPI001ABEA72E|nr:uncharacterized protein LOC121008950 [Bufo bufo]XP_040297721.1 uncharacterized protein LOC121008950 [Bufo bufo]